MKNPSFLKEFDEIVYLFQGGGALGAFQVGVYKALEEFQYTPNWMVGISIGAINASIIAGNTPELRLNKLHQFWEMVTHSIEPTKAFCEEQDKNLIQFYNFCSANLALMLGQKNFFNPVPFNPWLRDNAEVEKLSYYETTPLKNTLQQVVDFDYLNQGKTRLSLGAVNIETGRLVFFDNRKQKIKVEHILASCALPPGFPAVEIDGAHYWDGGLYSNTPIICVINDEPHRNRLCFLVDLFESTGLLPKNMDEAIERSKDINYAGHLDMVLGYYELQLFLQRKIADCIQKLPENIKQDPNIIELAKYGDPHKVHIAKIVYSASPLDLNSKSYEFSHYSAKRRFKEGYDYTIQFLSKPNWWKTDENLGNV